MKTINNIPLWISRVLSKDVRKIVSSRGEYEAVVFAFMKALQKEHPEWTGRYDFLEASKCTGFYKEEKRKAK